MYNKETYLDIYEDEILEWLDDNSALGMFILVGLMDYDIRKKVDYDLAPCTDEEFIRAYCKAHHDAYGEYFLISNETNHICF